MKAKFEVTVKFTKVVEIEDSCEHDDDSGLTFNEPNCGKEKCRQNLMDKAIDEVAGDRSINRAMFDTGFKSTIEVDER